jgi:hypothetical protein
MRLYIIDRPRKGTSNINLEKPDRVFPDDGVRRRIRYDDDDDDDDGGDRGFFRGSVSKRLPS